jgi:hypothetical protein
MSYPSAPWALKGFAVQTLQLVDTAHARSFVPPELEIISVLPGKTLGVMYLASYGPGSILAYNELIIVPALTRYRTKIGFWISHIYVDHPDSMAGGRAIWGLPKELAQFTWQTGEQNQVVVRQGERMLLTLKYGQQRRLWRQPLFLPAISQQGGDLLWFKGTFTAQLGFGRGQVDIPAESPFAALGRARAVRTYHYNDMRFVAHAPRAIGLARVLRQV